MQENDTSKYKSEGHIANIKGTENGYSEPTAEQEINLLDYARIFYKYRLVILLCLAIVLVITYYYTDTATRIYQASSRILFETTRQPDLMFMGPGISDSKITNTIELMKSRPVRELAYEMLQRDPDFDRLPISDVENPIGYLGNLQSERRRDTDILTISFASPEPLEAALIPNYIAQALIEQVTQNERAELYNVTEFLEDQVEIVSSRLRVAEEDLRMYKIDRGIYMLSAETTALINRSSDVEAAFEEAINQKAILEEKISYLENELGRQDSIFVDINSVITSSYMERLRSEVVSIQTRITNLVTRHEYPLDHPEIVHLNRQLSNAKEKLNQEIQRVLDIRVGTVDPLEYRSELTQQMASALIELNITESRVRALSRSLEEYNAKLAVLPDKELELARLERNYRINEKIHSLLVEKYEDAKIAVQAKVANIRILDEASVPRNPIRPNVRMNYLVGLVIAIGLGIVSSLILNSLDTKIHTMEDMERVVGLPIFGTIPTIHISESEQVTLAAQLKKASGQEKIELMETQSYIEARLISHYAPKSPVAESYRTLRTNILARKKTDSMVIGVTSSAPKEGKTTTMANMGIIIAQTTAPVVLVDLDLRRPMQSKLFNLSKENGVSDYLIDPDMKVDSIIQKSKIPNLSVVTSGFIPPNPSEIIASARINQLLKELKERFEFVLIDNPPIIAVTDPLLVAKKVDMMLIVVNIDNTQKDIVKRSKELMANVGASFDGTIANGIIAQKYYSGYSYHYYYYSNYYYYEDDKSAKKKKGLLGKILRKG